MNYKSVFLRMSRGNGFLRCRVWATVVILLFILFGCGYWVSSSTYEKDKEKNEAQIKFVRKQLSAHTKILASQGRSINEIQGHLREASARARDAEKVSKRLEKSVDQAIRESSRKQPPEVERTPKPSPSSTRGHPIGSFYLVRSTYRGLSVNFAGGYRTPRGKRYPYKLPPGTLVQVLSEDKRGFTFIQVKTGQWKGKKMWVRTRWLIVKPTKKPRSSDQG